MAAATDRGIVVANTPSATTIPVAEHTIALLLAACRKIAEHDRMIRDGIWDTRRSEPELLIHGSVGGLVGFGNIARAVAQRLQPWGTRIIACDPLIDESQFAALGVEKVELPELLARADFVSLHVPLVEATHHLIGEAELRQMKSNSILINTARGKIVDNAALGRALREGWIQGAALDVLETEPPPPDDPVVGLPNVVASSHIASVHSNHLDDFWRLSMETVIDLARRKWPVSYVNPQVESRWEMANR